MRQRKTVTHVRAGTDEELTALDRLGELWSAEKIGASLVKPRGEDAIWKWRRTRKISGGYGPQIIVLLQRAEYEYAAGAGQDDLALTKVLTRVRVLYQRAKGTARWQEFEFFLEHYLELVPPRQVPR